MAKIKLLDCTLRDGGLALEDAVINGLSTLKFEKRHISRIIEKSTDAGFDIVEIGAVEISDRPKTGFAIYRNIEDISSTAPASHGNGQMFAALYRGPDTPLDDIPKYCSGLCEAVRVILRYSELKKSLDFCAGLSEKGYKVFVQPMLTMRYSDDEIEQLITASNEMNAYALYMVDSYGYMTSSDIEELFVRYDAGLKPGISVGFHAHNNTNLAFSNAVSFISKKTDRQLIVDSCVLGMGQGAGNLQTEIITDYLNKNFGKNYDYGSVLDICDIVQCYFGSTLWGYSVTRLLPALHKTAYKYAVSLREHYGLSYREIDDILRNMPDELRHRYTKENTAAVLKACGYDISEGV